MKTRLLKAGEKLQEPLFVGFPKIDANWVWIAGEPPQAVMYGCDMQGMAQLIVLRAVEDAPANIIVSLFTRVFHDLRKRGYTHFMTWLSATKQPEMKMARMVQRIGGALQADSGWIASAAIPERKASEPMEIPIIPISDNLKWVLQEVR